MKLNLKNIICDINEAQSNQNLYKAAYEYCSSFNLTANFKLQIELNPIVYKNVYLLWFGRKFEQNKTSCFADKPITIQVGGSTSTGFEFQNASKWGSTPCYVSRVAEYHKKSFQHLTTFRSTWWGDCKNILEIEIARWYIPAKKQNPSNSTFLSFINLSSKSFFTITLGHRGNFLTHATKLLKSLQNGG